MDWLWLGESFTAEAVLFAISSFSFLGFIALFFVPDFFMTGIYLAPKATKLINEGKLQRAALWSLIKKQLILLLIIILLYLLAYFFNPSIAEYLIDSPLALFCWALALVATLWAFAIRRKEYLDGFYTGIYMEHISDSERDKYRSFIDHVEQLSIAEAKTELDNSQLSFLERKALNERLFMLQNTDRVDY